MKRRLLALAGLGAVIALAAATAGVSATRSRGDSDQLAKVNHLVVIYQENHSFDNLYGYWEGVNGLGSADYRHTVQVSQAGQVLGCLPQLDVNLTSPSPLPTLCTDNSTGTALPSAFGNAPFLIDPLVPATAKTCPANGAFAPNGFADGTAGTGGCTRDIVHRFYQEQYQLDGGAMNHFTVGSDAAGLTQGVYNTYNLPIYQYLHAKGHPRYAIADNFFQSAFGGSFLNHQWLIAARTPAWNGAVNDGSANDLHSVVDANGMPGSTLMYKSPAAASVKDQALTASCAPGPGRGATPGGVVCGDYAVNTIQPTFQPYAPGTSAARQLPPLKTPTIGDELTAKRVDWAWYSGGWSNANGDVGAPGWTNGTAAGPATAKSTASCSDANAMPTAVWPNCPDGTFQFHHQAFNYYAAFDPSTAEGKANRKAHLKDEAELISAATGSTRRCALKPVSFVKPLGVENEHPGYASEPHGSDHVVNLLKAIEGSACAADTMVVVTYDEFGGQWDHVPPPGQGAGATGGPHDAFGPGTRIPALVVSPLLKEPFAVDHAEHDTTSILATIEHRWGVKALGSRDAKVTDLSSVFDEKADK